MTTTIACSLGLHKRCYGQANASDHINPKPEEQVRCECPCHDTKEQDRK